MIGVIADDLTGAAEIGAIGLRHGLRAEIIRSGKPGGKADLVCVDTDSRACEPKEAAKRAAAAAKMLRAAGAQWIYKKVDSVLRGQVTAELEAVMQQLKLKRGLLLPANPSLGRTIKDGHYFLRGRPLHKTEFANDPHFPRRSSQVLRLVKVPETISMLTVNGDRLLIDHAIVIGDAGSPADLQRWATNCDAEVLPAGGAEFFNALLTSRGLGKAKTNLSAAKKLAVEALKKGIGSTAKAREFFVVGTSTQSARKFVAAERRKKTPVFALPQELAWGATFSPAAVEAVAQRVIAAFDSNERVVLNIGLPQVRDAGIAGRLSDHVVRVAARVLSSLPVKKIFAEGGATATALVRRMAWTRLEVIRELAPGVATLAVGFRQRILLTIKPGTYVWPAQWT